MRLRSKAFALSFAVNCEWAATTLASTEARVDWTRGCSLSENNSLAIFISFPIMLTTVSILIVGSGF